MPDPRQVAREEARKLRRLAGDPVPAYLDGLIDLHCHAYGSVPAPKAAERLLALGPNLADFARRHDEAYGFVPDLNAALEAVRTEEPGAQARFEQIYCLQDDGGDRWARFQAKYNILTATSAFRRQPRSGPLIAPVVEELRWLIDTLAAHFQSRGVSYAEIRFMIPGMLNMNQARQCLLVLIERMKGHSTQQFRLDLAVSLPRVNPLLRWPVVCELMQRPEMAAHLTAVDFCHSETDLGTAQRRQFAQQFHAYNEQAEHRLSLLIHAGEQIQRRGLAAALEDVADAIALGCHRIGHGLALFIDPHQVLTSAEAARVVARQAELLDECCARALPIESCPLSNRLLLGDWWEKMRTDVPAGVRVLHGSDDSGLFSDGVSDRQ